MIRFYQYITLFFTLSVTTYAQEASDPLQNLLEYAAENSVSDINVVSIYDDLQYLLRHPINLNLATEEDLQKLFVLNDFMIANLFNYISKSGELLSIYELDAIYGFDISLINSIKPFVSIEPSTHLQHFKIKEAFSTGKNMFLIRGKEVVEDQAGYYKQNDPRTNENPNYYGYLGSPIKLYARYRYTYYDQLSLGLTGEKDEGENFFKGSNSKGFDFYSGHLYIKDAGILQAFALGDYHVSFGQGLVAWSGMAYGKSDMTMNTRRHERGITPYTATDENRFMRGSAASFELKKSRLTVFYSSKYIDANIVSRNYDESSTLVSSFLTSGIHATMSQLNDEDAINEKVSGANLSYKNRKFKLGITHAFVHYSAHLLPPNLPYNIYRMQGNSTSNTGVDYYFVLKNCSLFGEGALTNNGYPAIINGMQWRLSSYAGVSLLHRYYHPGYIAPYSNAFAESSENRNENGFFIGSDIIISPTLNLNAYADLCHFPWLKYNVDAPSIGTEYMARLQYSPSDKTKLYIRYRTKTKQENSDVSNSKINKLVNSSVRYVRFHISYRLSKEFALSNRIESSYCEKESEKNKGFMMYNDIDYSLNILPLMIRCRYAIFNTDDYNSRIYVYEDDLLYEFAVPALYYKGTRAYLMLQYKLKRSSQLWFKISRTYYTNRTSISSAMNEIDGNKRTDVKLQLMINF